MICSFSGNSETENGQISMWSMIFSCNKSWFSQCWLVHVFMQYSLPWPEILIEHRSPTCENNIRHTRSERESSRPIGMKATSLVDSPVSFCSSSLSYIGLVVAKFIVLCTMDDIWTSLSREFRLLFSLQDHIYLKYNHRNRSWDLHSNYANRCNCQSLIGASLIDGGLTCSYHIKFAFTKVKR